jgi:tripartite-type tricarboxylate transporter receptor subunit TctC
VPIRTGLDVGPDKFTPLGAIGFDLNSLSVAIDSPYRTLKEFIAAARDKPNTISVGITSPGGNAHYLMHRLEKLTGARFCDVRHCGRNSGLFNAAMNQTDCKNAV